MNRLNTNNRRTRSQRRSKNRRRRSWAKPSQQFQRIPESEEFQLTIEDVTDEPEAFPAPKRLAIEGPKVVFQVQLAHGSAVGTVKGVQSVAELYDAIASCYDDVEAGDILFCTLDTPKLKMDNVVGNSLPVDRFIFAHLRGQKKEVRLVKTHPQLGLTVSDNLRGKSFIKKIKEGSVGFHAQPAIEIGDHIAAINGVSMEGKRHVDVARTLRRIPVGEEFVIRLVSPKKSGFNFIAPRNVLTSVPSPNSLGSGHQTLRFKANGKAVLQEAPNIEIVERMNAVFDEYLGLHDDDLALTVWEIGSTCRGFVDMENKLRESSVGVFGFPDELVFDMWGIVQDFKKKLEVEGRQIEPSGGF
ncbi:hypothetical protein L596_016161 [Steinernema carpocapsae]|uniref:PDZ domain-containing protein n=2 Tax=Steinernema carpocapsae TaxID=34508 RepID=A0A4U5NHZ0_STECR|nr:hypothetical protein L596_016161 [Steinernema carpocapsae]